MKLVIERAKWLRGEGGKASRLLRPKDGKMCCVGFAALALGHTEDEIRDRRCVVKHIYDEQLSGDAALAKFGPQWGGDATDGVLFRLYDINDAEHATDGEREGRVVALFAKVGVDVEFT